MVLKIVHVAMLTHTTELWVSAKLTNTCSHCKRASFQVGVESIQEGHGKLNKTDYVQLLNSPHGLDARVRRKLPYHNYQDS
jgi:hypothetical protein